MAKVQDNCLQQEKRILAEKMGKVCNEFLQEQKTGNQMSGAQFQVSNDKNDQKHSMTKAQDNFFDDLKKKLKEKGEIFEKQRTFGEDVILNELLQKRVTGS